MKKFKRRMYLKLRKRLGKDPEVFAPHGVPIRVPEDTDLAITYLLAKGRPYEEEEAGMVQGFMAPGTNVIELGGCMGIVSALIRKTIGPDAQHIIVEANPRLVPICEANATIGAAEGKTRVLAAAIDYSGAETVTFAAGPNAHMGRVGAGGEAGVTVPALQLSELAKTLPDGPFALVCDIEGGELSLFAAERDLLNRIDLIVLETHPHIYAGGAADMAPMMAAICDSGLELVKEEKDVICFQRKPR
ncbi:MAG: FkbM family methyltransferase [Albidovulum sp.]